MTNSKRIPKKKFNIVAIIPARKNSKGIKNKNLREIDGISLLEHSINHAIHSKIFNKIIVSTDSVKMKNIAIRKGALVRDLRPMVHSSDTAKTIDVIRYEIDNHNLIEDADCIVILQPTSPLRSSDEIKRCMDLHVSSGFKSVVTVNASNEKLYLYREIDNQGNLKKIYPLESGIRRQDSKLTFKINGSIYINSISDYKNPSLVLNDNLLPFIISKEKSIDIDSLEDLKTARKYYRLHVTK